MELLVVIAIIGILATLVLLQLGSARARARDTQRITTISQMRTAVEQYYNDKGYYPVAATWSALCGIVAPSYLTNCAATDPSGNAYNYAYGGSATKPSQYHLWVELEKSSTSLSNDSDLNSTTWTSVGGTSIDASNAATSEACTAAYGAATRDCIYDVGVQ